MTSTKLSIVLKSCLAFLTLIIISVSLAGQGIYNNGSKIIVPSGNFVFINSGNYTNETVSATDGSITLGGTITLDGNWTNNASGILTLAGGTVVFDGSSTQNITGTSYTSFSGLTSSASADVQVPAGKYLTVTGTLTMTGDLTLKAPSNLTTPTASLIDAGTTSGDITVERYLTGGVRTHFVSSPVHAGSFSSIYDASNGNYNVYYYNELNTSQDPSVGWTRITSGSLTDALGYTAIYTSGNIRTFNGSLSTGSDITIDITRTSSGLASADGWNLIGNPYPSPIDADAFISDGDNSSLYGSLYFWDDDGTGGSGYDAADYGVYNYSTTATAATGGGGIGMPNGTIAIGQAFFVKKFSGTGSNTIHFKNSHRTHSSSAQFFTPDPNEFQRLKISLSNEYNLKNETYIVFSNEATDEVDRLYDAEKLKGNPNIAMYTIWKDSEWALLGLPTISDRVLTVPLGIETAIDIPHILKIEKMENFFPDTKIFLEDRQLDKMIDLSQVQEYEIPSGKGNYQNRFFIHFNPTNISIPEPKANAFSVYTNGKNIVIVNPANANGIVVVNDMLGKKIFSSKLESLNSEISIDQAKGYYLVQIISEQGNTTKKVFIQ